MDCLFCNIANKAVESTIVYEDDHILAFKDIHPKTPVHTLVIPKKHIESVNHIEEEHRELVSHLLTTIKKIANTEGVASGYQLVANVGEYALIPHLHFHLMGGKKFFDV